MSQTVDEAVDATLEGLLAYAEEELTRDQPILRELPGGGRWWVERPLPFLCVYRQPIDSEDRGTADLVTTEAAFLLGSGDPARHEFQARLCEGYFDLLGEQFDAVLLPEVWAGEPEVEKGNRPGFRILAPPDGSLDGVVEELETALKEITIRDHPAEVEVEARAEIAPPGMSPLGGPPDGEPLVLPLGLEVRPIHQDPSGEILYPLILRELRRQLSHALRRLFFAFAGIRTTSPPEHFHDLGPWVLAKEVGAADRKLAEVAAAFDFLLQVTPVNADELREEFFASRYQREPVPRYRPLPYAPTLLKRKLFAIPLETIEDPTLEHLMREKQDELDREITALKDIGRPEFLYSSLRIYGKPDEDLLRLARDILRLKTPRVEGEAREKVVDAKAIVARGSLELNRYRERHKEVEPKIELRDDIAASLMVSRGRLLVDPDARLTERRMEALIQHEVGTHLLTYFNGMAQPFQQLANGLAGYEPLQEGLAVLAEYLSGGLTHSRMRILAARVVAVQALIDGATFVETFRELTRRYGLASRRAFITTLRVFRGGGLTKDAVYLRGLRDLLAYLGEGHELEPLLLGKIALHHVPFIHELRRRTILKPPALLPGYLDERGRERLDACRHVSVTDLLRTY